MKVVQILIGLNIAWFLAMVCGTSPKTILLPTSDLLLDWGASAASETLAAGQFWRLITCSFVHVGIFHLGVNMFVLRDVGREVEDALGKIRFLTVYLFAAAGGALISLYVNPLLVSAGASGAIFGVFGSMLATVWRRPNLFPKGYLLLHGKIVLCLIIYSIIFSFIDKNTDNAAHFGGFVSGFLAGLCVLPSQDGLNSQENLNRRADSKQSNFASILPGSLLAATIVLATGAAYTVFANRADVVADNRYHKAVKLLQSKNYRAALPLLNETISLDPKNTSAYCDRARANMEVHAYGDALADANSAIELDSKSKVAYTVRSAIHQKQGRYADAVKDLSKVIDLDPDDSMAYNNRAWSEEAAGSLPAAIADCDKSLKIKSTSATAYDTKAVASILMGQEKQAEDLLSKAIKLNSKDGAFYYHRAVARSRISNAAVSDASIAEDLGAYKKYGYEPEGWEPKLNTSMTN